MAVYDDQKEKLQHKPDGSHDDLGHSPLRRKKETDELEDLYKAESAEDGGFASRSEEKESGALDSATADDENDSLYNPDSGTRTVAGIPLNRRTGIIGTLIAAVITLTSIVGFIQTSTLIPNALREMLLGNLSSMQTNYSAKYRRKNYHKIQDIFTPNGRRVKAITAEMQKKGYTFAFDQKTGQLLKITPPKGAPIVGDAIGEHISDYLEVSHPLRTSRWKTKQMNAFYGRYKISRASPVAIPDGKVEDPDKTINKTIANEVIDSDGGKRVGGDVAEDSNDDTSDTARKQENKVLSESDGSLDELKAKLQDGTRVEDLTPDEQQILKVGSGEIDDAALNAIENVAKTGSFGGKLLSGIKSFGTSTDILDKICTVKNRLSAAVIAARLYRAMSEMKYTSLFIKASDSTRTNNTETSLLGSMMKRVTATDKNGNTIGASPGFAYALKNKFSKSQNDAFKGSFGVDGKLSGTAAAIQKGTDGIPGMSENQCGVYQNPAFQIGASAVEVAIGVFTGGSSAAAGTGFKETAKAAVKEGLQSLFTKQAAKTLAKQLTVELSFEGIMTLSQMYVEKTLAVTFTGQEKGGELGDILVAGGGVLNKQRSLKAGMVPATKQQYAEAHAQYIAEKNEANKHKSLYARVLDYNNPDSLTFKTATSLAFMPRSPDGIANSVRNNTQTMASNLFRMPQLAASTLASGFGGTALAQSTDEINTETLDVGGNQLAADPAGNMLPILRSDIESIDPTENIEFLKSSGDIDPSTLEPKSENFTEHITNCVDGVDTITTIEKQDQTDPKFDCLASQAITVRYKAHLAYLDMVDGVDAALFPDEVSASQESPAASGPAGPSEIVGGDTSNMTCAAGTDAGVGDGYKDGTLYKIRLCKVQGVTVNAQIAANVDRLYSDARAAGVIMSGGGFRTMQGQIDARKANNCPDIYNAKASSCRPPTARPGYSNHQMGLAIDFTQGGSTLTKGSSGFSWMRANAANYGLKNLPSEAWHWSVDGN